MKESLGTKTLKMAMKKEELIIIANKKEAEAAMDYEKALRIFNEVAVKLENGDFYSERSRGVNEHIITVKLDKEIQLYNKYVEEIFQKLFIQEGFESTAYNGRKVTLVLKE